MLTFFKVLSLLLILLSIVSSVSAQEMKKKTKTASPTTFQIDKLKY